MKKLLLLSLILISSYAVSAIKDKQRQVLRHVVLFGWKPGTDPTAIDKVVTAFGDLEHKIKLIKAYEWGVNNSPENLNNGLTHCFTLTFNSEADRDAYLIHPDHKALVALLNPAPDKVTVVDYWTTK
ncbi:Dabb family protein [Flavobacterium xanthum]|uniref:Stress responsive A/B Barrel Domain n=1 Tax=Flavobacterium xanthum TaxID=69322 RepID=A0A1M7AKU1_9FLAO|nr:Dabb family protein [Flavobacterium xanthum]SHL43380.1 Stress responsive A/B Barrel Domain [Flavobacterium xanthum]